MSELKTWVVKDAYGDQCGAPLAEDSEEALYATGNNLSREALVDALWRAGFTATEKPEMVEVSKEDLKMALASSLWSPHSDFSHQEWCDARVRLLRAADLTIDRHVGL
jgi:hypothetical protein